MYVRKESKETFIAFLLGYELGTESKCQLSDTISEFLSSQFKIKKQTTGWPSQITEYANKYKLSWAIEIKQIRNTNFSSFNKLF